MSDRGPGVKSPAFAALVGVPSVLRDYLEIFVINERNATCGNLAVELNLFHAGNHNGGTFVGQIVFQKTFNPSTAGYNGLLGEAGISTSGVFGVPSYTIILKNTGSYQLLVGGYDQVVAGSQDPYPVEAGEEFRITLNQGLINHPDFYVKSVSSPTTVTYILLVD